MISDHSRRLLLILPAFLVISGSSIVPLLAIINYSVQDVFYGNSFFWVGTKWFEEVLGSQDFYASLFRSLLFSLIVFDLYLFLQ